MQRGRITNLLKYGDRKGRLLDVGCIGMDLDECGKQMERIEREGFESVVYLDVNIKLMRVQSNNRVCVCGNGCRLPFCDRSFKTVYLGEVIEHVWQGFDMIKEAVRVLEVGGLVILDTPNVYDLYRTLRYLLRGYCEMSEDHKVTYSRESLVKMLEDAGLKVMVVNTSKKYWYSILGSKFDAHWCLVAEKVLA